MGQNQNRNVAKKWKNLFVLIHFYEEKKYSVVTLKDATPVDLTFDENFDFKAWDTKQVVNAVWGDDTYPAYFLKFSENKKDLETHGMELARSFLKSSESLSINNALTSKRLKSSSLSTKKQKIGSEILKQVKEKIKSPMTESCSNCNVLQMNVSNMKSKISALKQDNYVKNQQIADLEKKVKKYKGKYYASKEKLSKAVASPTDGGFFKIGEDVLVPLEKLALCRTSCVSKYTGDLMEVVFGPEILATHLLKGIKGSTKKFVLDKLKIEQIQSHAALKFGVGVQQVRSAMRLKLNYCHKMAKQCAEIN